MSCLFIQHVKTTPFTVLFVWSCVCLYLLRETGYIVLHISVMVICAVLLNFDWAAVKTHGIVCSIWLVCVTDM